MEETLKYMDIFGTKLNFYSNKKKKYYTTLGGILSIISILICIIVFIIVTKDDFERKFPHIIFFSNIPRQQKKINLEQKNIWIPWRIIDSTKQHIDNNSLVYPIISYFYAERKTLKDDFQLKSKKIQYILCNETTMKNLPSTYYIQVPLNELYCFNSTDLELGGSLNDLFINHLIIDFFLCKDDENPKCSNVEKINEIIGEKSTLEIEIYYPIVYFEPTNLSKPISIFYNKYFYYISKFSNKIDKLYLQNTILMDENGLVGKYINNFTYWETGRFEGDVYINMNKNDTLENENSSKVYSLHIYLEENVKKYVRSYKKLKEIISEGLSVIFILYVVFKRITKIIKTSEENRELIELLFENTIIKPSKIMERINRLNLNIEIKSKKENDSWEKHNSSRINKSQSKCILMNNSSKQNNISKSNVDIFRNPPKSTFAPKKSNINDNFSDNICEPANSNIVSFISNYIRPNFTPNQKPKMMNKNFSPRKQRKEPFYMNDKSSNLLYLRKNIKFPSEISSHFSTKLIPKKLFSKKYYFFWAFFKTFDVSKRTFCFPKKFVKANVFLGQLLDISSYLYTQKEFQILKYRFLSRDKLTYLEKKNKINISASGFIRNMNECLENKKLNILADDISINYT